MKHFDKEINNVFKPLRSMQLITAFIFIVNTFIRYFLLVEIQKMTDSISTNAVNIIWEYLKYYVILAFSFFFLNCILENQIKEKRWLNEYVIEYQEIRNRKECI